VIESDTIAFLVCQSVGLQTSTASVIHGSYSVEGGLDACRSRQNKPRLLTACNFLTPGESYLGRAWLKEYS